MIYFIVLILFLTLVPLLLLITKKATKPYPPEPSGAWPVIGHLPLLGSPFHLAHTLGHLAEKHGPIFGLRLGMQRVVVVSSREAVMECFTTNDKSFARRPRSSAGLHLVYDHASFGFTNGPYWRETRKLVMAEVLSPRRLETMRDLRVNEIEMSIRELHVQATGKRPKAVVLSRWIDQVALNIIVKTIAGKRIYAEGEVEKFRNLFRELTFLSGEFVLSDVIPIRIIKWIDDRGNVVKRMKYVARELDVIIEAWIKEHVERREKVGKPSEGKDFIDELLSVIDDRFDKYGLERITIIKATVVNVVLGGFDTTSVYVTWLLALLVNHKSVMKLAQEEIDAKVGKQRWVLESDIKNFPYLEAIIKESLRLYPPLPLSIPHEAEEDCQLGGYYIQKGTLLFVNLLKLHRDSRVWEEPDKFMPERFLTKHAHVDVIGQQFEFTPFGAGRRSCPGTTFAMQVTNLMVARLIQGFNFASPGDGPIDMAEGVGITMPKANPLEVMLTPRLHPQLYTNKCTLS